MRNPTYIASEPTPVEGYQSDRGKVFATREDALKDNFNKDLSEACRAFESEQRLLALSVEDVIIRFARAHPDMLRILVGDRDYT